MDHARPLRDDRCLFLCELGPQVLNRSADLGSDVGQIILYLLDRSRRDPNLETALPKWGDFKRLFGQLGDAVPADPHFELACLYFAQSRRRLSSSGFQLQLIADKGHLSGQRIIDGATKCLIVHRAERLTRCLPTPQGAQQDVLRLGFRPKFGLAKNADEPHHNSIFQYFKVSSTEARG